MGLPRMAWVWVTPRPSPCPLLPPSPLLAPLTLLWPSPNPPACSPETIQAWPMTEESSGSPRSRRWRAGGEVIAAAARVEREAVQCHRPYLGTGCPITGPCPLHSAAAGSLPAVLAASWGLGGHLLPLPERTRQLPRERPALIATIQERSTGVPPPPARPGTEGSSLQVRPASPPADCPG